MFPWTLLMVYYTQWEEISVIIIIGDCLYYNESKSPYNFILILIFNELFKFKTSYKWQH